MDECDSRHLRKRRVEDVLIQAAHLSVREEECTSGRECVRNGRGYKDMSLAT